MDADRVQFWLLKFEIREFRHIATAAAECLQEKKKNSNW